MTIDIKYFFDKETATFTYVVADIETKKSAIIDSVLNYDQYSVKTTTTSADQLISYLKEKKLTLEWILETHIHADHLTAAIYIKEKMGGSIGIGSKITQVLNFWAPIFNTSHDTPLNGVQFDSLFLDNQIFQLGNTPIKALHTPGHTPACTSYLIEDALFVGDTLLMPDLGTARTDFPGGSASTLYDSIHRIFSLPDTTRIFICHDYPPEGREASCLSSMQDQKTQNILINEKITKTHYVDIRNKRDEGKPVPKLLLPSIQFNLRAGSFGKPDSNSICYIKIPINKL